MSNLAQVETDITEGFRDAMAEAGLIHRDPIHADGKLHRFRVEGDRRGTRNGWYVLHGDGVPAGAFDSWKGITGTWRARSRMSRQDSAVMRDRMKAAIRAASLERERSGHDAAERARRLWEAAKPADPQHGYLRSKRVQAHGLRQHGESLLVPVRDVTGEIMSLQRIEANGEKRFLPGGRITGGFHILSGDPPGAFFDALCRVPMLVIAEGYATAATIWEITDIPVVIAFNAGNLKPVAEAIQARLGSWRPIFAADNDHHGQRNVGIEKAREAAHAIGGGQVIAPPPDEGITDWNDWYGRNGSGLITEVFP